MFHCQLNFWLQDLSHFILHYGFYDVPSVFLARTTASAKRNACSAEIFPGSGGSSRIYNSLDDSRPRMLQRLSHNTPAASSARSIVKPAAPHALATAAKSMGCK